MYALRFFIGLFEACAFPGYIALLGGWYGPRELTKRVAILLEIESIASMFSGYLQTGLYSSLNGHHGIVCTSQSEIQFCLAASHMGLS